MPIASSVSTSSTAPERATPRMPASSVSFRSGLCAITVMAEKRGGVMFHACSERTKSS